MNKPRTLFFIASAGAVLMVLTGSWYMYETYVERDVRLVASGVMCYAIAAFNAMLADYWWERWKDE